MTDNPDQPEEESKTEQDHGFFKALRITLNDHCRENGSNTPDHILASYLLRCLTAFEEATASREAWYGVELYPGMKAERK